MFIKQYNDYLLELFIQWVSQDVQAGLRYQIKSPNTENALELYDAFLRKADKNFIRVGDVDLPFVACANVQIIPVLHDCGGEGFTENYISFLRDEVASRSGAFEQSALFIIHNSMLDTLVNSALDIGAAGSIWSPESVAKVLKERINEDIDSSRRELFNCLLQDQLELIVEEGATVFRFEPLFGALVGGNLDFNAFGLFNDTLILDMSGQPEQIRNRLDENRELYSRIEYSLEHYSDQLESVLDEFSPKFIKEHFEGSQDWSSLELELYLDESRANKIPKLSFEYARIDGNDPYQRAKSQTKAGLKEISLLFEAENNKENIELILSFFGNDLKEEQLKIRADSTKPNVSVSRTGGKRCKAIIKFAFSGEPVFLSIDIKRENHSEEYKFRCLILEKDSFYLEEIKNCFRVDSLYNRLTLLLAENELCINPSVDEVFSLAEGQNDIDANCYGVVNFEEITDQTDTIQFTISSNEKKLLVNVEGPAAEEKVNIPLLFDLDRFHKLLNDDYNAEYNRLKNKIIIDNNESLVVGVRQSLLAFESKLIVDRLLYTSDIAEIKLDDMQMLSLALYHAYDELFKYFEKYKTLPSIVAWGKDFCAIVQNLLDVYEAYLVSIPKNDVLTTAHKQILKIGLHKKDDKERISPIHPIVLAYYLQLVRDIRNDTDLEGKSSFTKLPSVTLDRLVPSGLLPFVYHEEAEFAHVVPVKENIFWLDIVPQKQVSYNYVKRLVKDKLAEFTQAYSRLFNAGSRSTLIINCINQGVAAELFLGLIEHFKGLKEKAFSIHVNFYDDTLVRNHFDRFSETSSYDELKKWLALNTGSLRAEADILIDIIRSRLTYSKFTTPKEGETFAYAHLAFFRNNIPVDCRPINIDEALSGVLCDGLIAGEASETKGGAYFTSFGLREVDSKSSQAMRLAYLLGNLWQPAQQANMPYLSNGIGLAVSTDFEGLLSLSYDSALWTTIIDPKVTLDFFTSQKDVVLIHYSDQYTTSAGYDAITVTKQVDLFKLLLSKESGSSANNLLSEFNAFNGEWLLKMLTAPPKDRKEKNGIIGAYKFISALLSQSDISWVPLSVAEIIRVSGNVGLKMDDSEFSRHVHGYRKGAISDDVLFVGFKEDTLYLLPVEVKTGARPDFTHAIKQAKELGRYLMDDVLKPRTLASRLYRGLFIRQVLMQVEKFQLYQMITTEKLDALLSRREWWLKGEYQVSKVPNYVDGFVLAHVDSDTCFELGYQLQSNNILQIELPYGFLRSLMEVSITKSDALMALLEKFKVNQDFILKPNLVTYIQDIPVVDALLDSTTPVEQEVEKVVEVNKESEPLKVLFGHDSWSNEALFWEPTNTAKFMNTNTGIIGTMGTGKTQFTKSVITQLMQNQSCNVSGEPIGILIFDYKSDYVDDAFLEANQAKAFKLHGLPYNPLSLYGNMPMLPVHTATGFAETMALAFGLGQKQQLKLRKLILDAYELAGISRTDSTTWQKPAPTIAQIWDIFSAQDKVEEDSLYAALDSLVSFEIFEANPDHVSSLYDLVSGVTVVELAGYSPQIQSLIVALTLDLFYSQMQKRGKPQVQGDYRQITKMVLVDEADNFMSQDFPSLRKILKEGREYGVGVILSTQDITHFKTGENNYASYVLTWVIHRVSAIKNADIKAIFNIDDKSEQEQLMEKIRKLDKHFSLYIDGDKQVKRMRDRAFWEL